MIARKKRSVICSRFFWFSSRFSVCSNLKWIMAKPQMLRELEFTRMRGMQWGVDDSIPYSSSNKNHISTLFKGEGHKMKKKNRFFGGKTNIQSHPNSIS